MYYTFCLASNKVEIIIIRITNHYPVYKHILKYSKHSSFKLLDTPDCSVLSAHSVLLARSVLSDRSVYIEPLEKNRVLGSIRVARFSSSRWKKFEFTVLFKLHGSIRAARFFRVLGSARSEFQATRIFEYSNRRLEQP